ncbi:MAG TPA: hypothetical protein DDW51_01140 [Cyanobacteria bacterium UBA11367]|nr:hypothetical protein [Cyanobacteria bacterium UBA11367]HBE58316.1 hypothetical protein [Cyanobacteria bacterium UBA11366]HBK62651.1 hypothetical protein [Cyanobacteria bacterium UBA11166]
MSELRILDLDFCESRENRKVEGGYGISVSSPTGSWSAGASSAHQSGYFTGFFFDRSTGDFGYAIGGFVAGSVAGAVAGALSDGSTYSGTFTSAGIF